jgi:hypothetical protein
MCFGCLENVFVAGLRFEAAGDQLPIYFWISGMLKLNDG